MRNNNKAFTLMELLLAVLIFSVMALSLYAIFSSGLRVWRKQQEGFIYGHSTKLALDRMAKELRNAIKYSIPTTGEVSEDTKNLRFIGENQKMSFITIAGGNIAKVTYLFEQGENQKGTLKRIIVLQKEGFKEKNQKEEVAIRDLKDCLLKYAYKGAGEDSLPAWGDSWGMETSEAASKIPQGVQVILTFEKGKGENKKDEVIKKTIFIPAGTIEEQEGL